MGTYYQVVNYDKHEVIDLFEVTNIKAGAFEAWSLQTAILNTFLGFSWRGELSWPEWTGRWAGDRIEIQNDATVYPPGKDTDEGDWPDAGMMFLSDLKRRGVLQRWIDRVMWSQYWEGMQGNRGLEKWEEEQRK